MTNKTICNSCGKDLLHEGDGVTEEAEYCYHCEYTYCAEHMDFSVNDNTCIHCAQQLEGLSLRRY